MKGCSNRCGWCHNPESFTAGAQLQYFPQRCTGCMKCADACKSGVHYMTGGVHALERSRCTMCGACAAVCYADALTTTGRRASVDEVVREVMEDAPYYETSGGGVTISGGEPVLQQAFTLELLVALKRAGVHTNLQTAGNYPFETLEPLLPYLDMVMYDLKSVSESVYERHIHGSRALMLDNLLKLDAALDARAGAASDAQTAAPAAPSALIEPATAAAANAVIIVRTPVIEGVNATEADITAIARFIKPLKRLESYRLIPYHGLGKAKYDALGQMYENTYATPSAAAMEALEKAACAYVPVYNHTQGYLS